MGEKWALVGKEGWEGFVGSGNHMYKGLQVRKSSVFGEQQIMVNGKLCINIVNTSILILNRIFKHKSDKINLKGEKV